MTIKNLFETLDYTSYDKIFVHWPDNTGSEFNVVTFDWADACIELLGDRNIMTINETSEHDGGDASLFINADQAGKVIVHIYLKREDVVRVDINE
jgi:hypothetical protein